ncbi:hypothetical protein Dimus_026409 [Dionaea muscipula]
MGEVGLDGEGTWVETAKTSTTGHGFDDGEPVFVRIERIDTGNRLNSLIPFDFVCAIKDLGFLIWVMVRWEAHYPYVVFWVAGTRQQRAVLRESLGTAELV